MMGPGFSAGTTKTALFVPHPDLAVRTQCQRNHGFYDTDFYFSYAHLKLFAIYHN